MDRCERYSNRGQRDNPSFSSSLLDEIYRSIDEEGGVGEEAVFVYREAMRKKRSGDRNAVKSGAGCGFEIEERLTSLRRACEMGGLMEKKVMSEKVVLRRNFERKLNSSSSSSESSCGGGFSSSEAESGYGLLARPSGFTAHRPKPIRTSFPVQNQKFEQGKEMKYSSSHDQRPKHENSFSRTKSKALKIYGDLKKVKQPISPGGRLATFLNSLFTTSTPKKPKFSSSSSSTRASFDATMSREDPHSKSSCTSTCSSASSHARSCLSNSSSRRNPTAGGAKRSVRFYPVSVILGEDNRPQHKNELRNPVNEELRLRIMEKNRMVEEAAHDLLKNYHKIEYFKYYNTRDNRARSGEKCDKRNNNDDGEEDDAASCASSDLFELDNLSAIEELPVYETTHLHTNLAIAKGLIS